MFWIHTKLLLDMDLDQIHAWILIPIKYMIEPKSLPNERLNFYSSKTYAHTFVFLFYALLNPNLYQIRLWIRCPLKKLYIQIYTTGTPNQIKDSQA